MGNKLELPSFANTKLITLAIIHNTDDEVFKNFEILASNPSTGQVFRFDEHKHSSDFFSFVGYKLHYCLFEASENPSESFQFVVSLKNKSSSETFSEPSWQKKFKIHGFVYLFDFCLDFKYNNSAFSMKSVDRIEDVLACFLKVCVETERKFEIFFVFKYFKARPLLEKNANPQFFEMIEKNYQNLEKNIENFSFAAIFIQIFMCFTEKYLKSSVSLSVASKVLKTLDLDDPVFEKYRKNDRQKLVFVIGINIYWAWQINKRISLEFFENPDNKPYQFDILMNFLMNLLEKNENLNNLDLLVILSIVKDFEIQEFIQITEIVCGLATNEVQLMKIVQYLTCYSNKILQPMFIDYVKQYKIRKNNDSSVEILKNLFLTNNTTVSVFKKVYFNDVSLKVLENPEFVNSLFFLPSEFLEEVLEKISENDEKNAETLKNQLKTENFFINPYTKVNFLVSQEKFIDYLLDLFESSSIPIEKLYND